MEVTFKVQQSLTNALPPSLVAATYSPLLHALLLLRLSATDRPDMGGEERRTKVPTVLCWRGGGRRKIVYPNRLPPSSSKGRKEKESLASAPFSLAVGAAL